MISSTEIRDKLLSIQFSLIVSDLRIHPLSKKATMTIERKNHALPPRSTALSSNVSTVNRCWHSEKINILSLPNKNSKNKNGKVLLSFLLYITVVDHAPPKRNMEQHFRGPSRSIMNGRCANGEFLTSINFYTLLIWWQLDFKARFLLNSRDAMQSRQRGLIIK